MVILYIDDFQIVSPLGNKTKKHKITAIYWSLGNIPHQFRSKLYTIQLLCLTRTSNIKKHCHQIFKNIIMDIKVLESQGINIPGTNINMRGYC